MPTSVKRKIQVGTLFLFILLLLTGGAGIYFTAMLKSEAKSVLRDNYETIGYCYAMQQQLDEIGGDYGKAVVKFEHALKLQENNITEPGELTETQRLRQVFDKLKTGDTTKQNIQRTQYEIQRILYINMNAIQYKNNKANKTAENAQAILISLVAIVFLVAFTFSVNFPSIVTNPIEQFTEGIKAISLKNYKHRIHIDNKDEFGSLANAFNKMAERLEYFESSNLNKLLFEKSRAEAVINSLKDASIGIDRNNVVLFANSHALELLGLKADEIVGKPVKEVSERNDLFRFVADTDNSSPFKIVVDNRENYFVKEVVEVAQSDNNSKVIVLRNITTFKELDVAKTNFIATISHELKTPLAASDFGLKLLEDERIGTLSEEQRELIQSLKQDNQRILKIVSELLNMSQVETGKIQLDMKMVDAQMIVEKAVDTVINTARERYIRIEYVIEEHLPLINADAEKTTWVLNNLLTNAIKYSKEGGTINVAAKQTERAVTFSVADTGQGIAAEYLPKIFERYFQVPDVKNKGTGLGLSISKEFIEAQGGKIWVESEKGNGSIFSFSLSNVIG